jgi:hypothetical protein
LVQVRPDPDFYIFTLLYVTFIERGDYKRIAVFRTVDDGKHEVRRPLFFEDPDNRSVVSGGSGLLIVRRNLVTVVSVE